MAFRMRRHTLSSLSDTGWYRCRFDKKVMKISKFCWGEGLSDTIMWLAKRGMALAVLGILGGASFFALTFLIRLRFCSNCDLVMGYLVKGAAFLHILIHLGFFFYSYWLYKNNTDVKAVKKMIKIGCYVIGSVQAAAFAAILLTGIFLLFHFLIFCSGSLCLAIILILVGGLLLIMPSLLVCGIKTRSTGKIKTWIILEFGMLAFSFSIGLVSFFLFYTLYSWSLFYLIGGVLAFLYVSGIVIIHYNIVLEDQYVLAM